MMWFSDVVARGLGAADLVVSEAAHLLSALEDGVKALLCVVYKVWTAGRDCLALGRRAVATGAADWKGTMVVDVSVLFDCSEKSMGAGRVVVTGAECVAACRLR